MKKSVGGVIGFLAGGWLLVMVMTAAFSLFTDGGDLAGYIWFFLCLPVFFLGGLIGGAIGVVLAETTGADKTQWSRVAGVLSIIDGFVLALFLYVHMIASEAPDNLGGSGLYYWVLATVYAVSAPLAIVGGYCACRRRRWGLALAGAIAAVFPLFPLSPLGVTSVVLVALSRDKFE